ncbi:MAG: hypothetical protein LAO04_06565 [Acidobacteriia bacterium]|nr:hypothetical protein [Terriglobia bacterium]
MKNRKLFVAGAAIVAVLGLTCTRGLAKDATSILNQLSTVSTLASTVPANGDINPYGVAEVKRTVGNLVAGHFLISNFNAFTNLQGTGTTIVDVGPEGGTSLFAQIDPNNLPGACPGGVGLSTALVVLRSGWVIVGSLPTTDGSSATIGAGCLIVLDSTGTPVETFFGSLIRGPWDMTATEDDYGAKIFFTNVLNGTVEAGGSVVNYGTVVRMNLRIPSQTKPWIESMTVVAAGFPERTDPAALVIGPTGVGLSPGCDGRDGDDCEDWRREDARALYVADSLNNRIAVIPHALTRTTSGGVGFTFSSGGALNDPLGLIVTHVGHILTVNGSDGNIIEIGPHGKQIATKLIDNTGTPPGAGTLFGLAFDPNLGVVFVDDGSNTLNLLH